MEEKKIVLKNYENGEKFTDFFTGKEFAITNKVAYCFGDALVAPDEALRRGFIVDPKFTLPSYVNDRNKVAQFIQDDLKIHRGMNYDTYLKCFQHMSNGLPSANMEDLRPRTSR